MINKQKDSFWCYCRQGQYAFEIIPTKDSCATTWPLGHERTNDYDFSSRDEFWKSMHNKLIKKHPNCRGIVDADHANAQANNFKIISIVDTFTRKYHDDITIQSYNYKINDIISDIDISSLYDYVLTNMSSIEIERYIQSLKIENNNTFILKKWHFDGTVAIITEYNSNGKKHGQQIMYHSQYDTELPNIKQFITPEHKIPNNLINNNINNINQYRNYVNNIIARRRNYSFYCNSYIKI